MFCTGELADSIITSSAAVLDIYTPERYGSLFAGVRAIRPEAQLQYQAVKGSRYYRMIMLVDSRYWAALLCALLLLGWLAGIGLTCYAFCISGVLNLLIYYMLLSLVTESVSRYAVAHELVIALLASLLLCNMRWTRAIPRSEGSWVVRSN
jgi:hypothetical protein